MPRGFRELDVISTAAIASWFGFANWATYSVFVEGYFQLYAENGLIETLQAYLLAAACGIYLATFALERRSDKLFLLACSLLCYGFTLREVDVETFDIPRVLVLIGSGVGRNTSLAAAILAMVLYAVLTDLAHYRKAAAAFAKSAPGVLLMTGGVFLIIGEAIEKSKMSGHRVFFEEMAELFGYVLILLSSIAANAYLSGISIRSMRTGQPRA